MKKFNTPQKRICLLILWILAFVLYFSSFIPSSDQDYRYLASLMIIFVGIIGMIRKEYSLFFLITILFSTYLGMYGVNLANHCFYPDGCGMGGMMYLPINLLFIFCLFIIGILIKNKSSIIFSGILFILFILLFLGILSEDIYLVGYPFFVLCIYTFIFNKKVPESTGIRNKTLKI